METRNLGPYPDGGVPGGGAYGGAIWRYLEGGNSVLVAIEHGDPLTLERVPKVDSVVIVTWTTNVNVLCCFMILDAYPQTVICRIH